VKKRVADNDYLKFLVRIPSRISQLHSTSVLAASQPISCITTYKLASKI
jgi:hypothetical protein